MIRPTGCSKKPGAPLAAVASKSHAMPGLDDWLAAAGIARRVSVGSSLKFALVAAGEADVYPRTGPTMEWDTAAGDAVLRAAGGRTPGVGGAMDLAANAKVLWALLQHRDKKGGSKLLNACTLPITGAGCVDRIFTDLGVFDPTGTAFKVVDLAPGVTRELVEEATAGPVDWTGYDR